MLVEGFSYSFLLLLVPHYIPLITFLPSLYTSFSYSFFHFSNPPSRILYSSYKPILTAKPAYIVELWE